MFSDIKCPVELDALLASRSKISASNDPSTSFDLQSEPSLLLIFAHFVCFHAASDAPDALHVATSVSPLHGATSVSPDKENEPASCAAVPTIGFHASDSRARPANTRPSLADERESAAESFVCLSVGGTSVGRPSSSASSKPSTPLPLRAPPLPSGSNMSSSMSSSTNFRSSGRSDAPQNMGKPAPSPAVHGATNGPALRGKGWVAGISDSLGLSLSGNRRTPGRGVCWTKFARGQGI
jgi:hypothetical protein